MKRRFRYLWLVLILVALPFADAGYRRWKFWNDYERIVVWESWTVPLPRGGSITYRNQSPRMRPVIGPADTTKLFIWQKPGGQTQEYLISQIGAVFNNLELFIRPSGTGIWLTAWNGKQTIAALDFTTGRCFAGGVALNKNGNQDEGDLGGLPNWAKTGAGRSLGRRRF